MAIAVCVDSPSGRVPLINLRLPLIVAARYKNMGGGVCQSGAVKRWGCTVLKSTLRSVMAQLRRGVYTYFMTEAKNSQPPTPGPR